MSNVLLTTDSDDLRERVRAAAGGTCIALPGDPLPGEPAALLARLQHASLPDVLVLDATGSPEAALALAARFDRELPGTGIVLVGDPAALSLAALRAGVRDVVPSGADVAAWRETIDRVALAVQHRRQPLAMTAAGPVPMPQAPTRVLTVLSAKGGAGKTTLSTNLAFGLAEAMPGRVVLVDLDVQFGDVATALALEPEWTLDDIVHTGTLRDPIALKTRLTRHESGLSVICAPESPAAAEAITPEQVSALIELLSSQFQFVVIDTPPGLGPLTLAALDQTTDPLLITTFDVAGARGLAKELSTLRELGMITGDRHIVLNFADPRAGLSIQDVEATIRERVDLTIPHSKAATASFNIGVPLLQRKPRDPAAKQLRKLLANYSGVGATRASGRHKGAA